MQLGDDVAERFAAAAVAHPLSQWLGELLGQSDPALPRDSLPPDSLPPDSLPRGR
jgi:hypothetical protein